MESCGLRREHQLFERSSSCAEKWKHDVNGGVTSS